MDEIEGAPFVGVRVTVTINSYTYGLTAGLDVDPDAIGDMVANTIRTTPKDIPAPAGQPGDVVG